MTALLIHVAQAAQTVSRKVMVGTTDTDVRQWSLEEIWISFVYLRYNEAYEIVRNIARGKSRIFVMFHAYSDVIQCQSFHEW